MILCNLFFLSFLSVSAFRLPIYRYDFSQPGLLANHSRHDVGTTPIWMGTDWDKDMTPPIPMPSFVILF